MMQYSHSLFWLKNWCFSTDSCKGFIASLSNIWGSVHWKVKDTHTEIPSNKTPELRKSTNMSVWTAGTLNQLFIRGS